MLRRYAENTGASICIGKGCGRGFGLHKELAGALHHAVRTGWWCESLPERACECQSERDRASAAEHHEVFAEYSK